MTTYVQTREEARIARDEARAAREAARRARVREARIRQIRRMLWLFICWCKEVKTDLPAKIKSGAINTFSCTIILILMAALFFACLGLFELALTFWGNIYFG